MTIRWGILATGSIAHKFAEGVSESRLGQLQAVGSRSQESADHFKVQYPGLSSAHASYEALINDPEVDAIYVATPHTDHAKWAIRALQAGKAVLCEKPLGLNHAQVMAMVEAASRQQTFLMEAFMYRVHPQTQKILDLIAEGAIGSVRHIEAQFGFNTPIVESSRLFANELAGGGIMDVGCYPVSLARLVAGEPVEITGRGHIGQTGVDEWASALLTFAGDVTAQLSTAVQLDLQNNATIYGSEGRIEIVEPWHPRGNTWSLQVHGSNAQVVSGETANIYALEADHVAECLKAGLVQSPKMNWQDSLGNAAALDQWRAGIGLTYQEEEPANHPGHLLGGLSPQLTPVIPRQNLATIEKPVSRLVMGCDNQPSISHAAVMWDDFFERGGNCYDTAHIYGGGQVEALFGHWHSQREVREDIVLIGKGAHSPNCYPEAIATELDISLDRLQTDYIDVYFLHRDNLEIPVGDFISALNDEVSKGRIRTFGGSNWTLNRVREANEWAAENGLQGLEAISNNFSLATMISPVWPGVETASQPEYLTYLQEKQIPLFPWSSQARGFFTDWGAQVLDQHNGDRLSMTGAEPTAHELLRVWDSPENRARRARAAAIAEDRGTELINVALAYVLTQPFPTFSLVGPRNLQELSSCIRALEVNLTAEEVRFLANGAD
ncbi:MAG: oxidoreductase [Pseudomonadales bacterium]|nr:oxidoreductase [Pseudomonadales bacterium]